MYGRHLRAPYVFCNSISYGWHPWPFACPAVAVLTLRMARCCFCMHCCVTFLLGHYANPFCCLSPGTHPSLLSHTTMPGTWALVGRLNGFGVSTTTDVTPLLWTAPNVFLPDPLPSPRPHDRRTAPRLPIPISSLPIAQYRTSPRTGLCGARTGKLH